jgi:hypothetical protein
LLAFHLRWALQLLHMHACMPRAWGSRTAQWAVPGHVKVDAEQPILPALLEEGAVIKVIVVGLAQCACGPRVEQRGAGDGGAVRAGRGGGRAGRLLVNLTARWAAPLLQPGCPPGVRAAVR